MAITTVGSYRIHDGTADEITRVTTVVAQCTFDYDLLAGPIEVYFTSKTPLLPGSTTSRSWGYSYPTERTIKVLNTLTGLQQKYVLVHETGHIADYDLLNGTERQAIRAYQDPTGDYDDTWGKGPYRWRAAECFADDFARKLYADYGGALSNDYFHRHIGTGDVAAVKAILEGATTPDPEDDPPPDDPEEPIDEPTGEIESADGPSNIASAEVGGDIWLFIGADKDPAHIMELPVSDEDHRRPVQQEAFETLGSDRKLVIRGFVLGHEGTITAFFDGTKMVPSESDGATLVPETLRGRRLLEYLSNNRGPHTLKSPFGDTWEVEFEGPQARWIIGGHLEVDLSWTEIGDTSRLAV